MQAPPPTSSSPPPPPLSHCEQRPLCPLRKGFKAQSPVIHIHNAPANILSLYFAKFFEVAIVCVIKSDLLIWVKTTNDYKWLLNIYYLMSLNLIHTSIHASILPSFLPSFLPHPYPPHSPLLPPSIHLPFMPIPERSKHGSQCYFSCTLNYALPNISNLDKLKQKWNHPWRTFHRKLCVCIGLWPSCSQERANN